MQHLSRTWLRVNQQFLEVQKTSFDNKPFALNFVECAHFFLISSDHNAMEKEKVKELIAQRDKIDGQLGELYELLKSVRYLNNYYCL